MDISKTPQDSTKGNLPHGKEPAEPFKDEVDKTQKVNTKKQKYPSWMDHNTIENFARAEHHFLFSNRPDPYENILDEISIAKHDKEVASILARFEREKEPEPFKEEVDKTQKVDSTKGKLPRGKEPEPFKVDTEQKVIWPSQQLPLCFEPKIYGEVDTKQMKNKKLPRWSDPKTYEVTSPDDVAIRLSNGKHPFMYDKLIEPVESDDSDRPVESDYYDEPVESGDSDEPVQSILDEKTIAKHNTQVAGALDRSEREKELELSKEVDKTQKVDSTKGKLPSGKELEPFKEVDKTQKVDSTKGKLPSGKEPEPFKGNNHTM